MTRSMLLPGALLAANLAACGSAPTVPPGLTAGSFAQLGCSSGRPLQARYADDGRTVRVRAMHGAVELDRRGDGSFAGEDYVLRSAADGLVLEHKGKPESAGCKPR